MVFPGMNGALEAAKAFILHQTFDGDGQRAACGKMPCGAYQFTRAQHHAQRAMRQPFLQAMPLRPDADGLRHQLQRKPARQVAVRVQERSQNAPIVHRHAANGAVIGDVFHALKQQHRRVVRKIIPGR